MDGGREVRLAVAFGKMPEVRLLSEEPCYPHSLSSSLFNSLEKKMSSGLLFCLPEHVGVGVGWKVNSSTYQPSLNTPSLISAPFLTFASSVTAGPARAAASLDLMGRQTTNIG